MTWMSRTRWVPDHWPEHPALYHYIFAPSRSWPLIRDEVATDPRYADMPVQLERLLAPVHGRCYRSYEVRLCGTPWSPTLGNWEGFIVQPGVRPAYWEYEVVDLPVTQRLPSPP